MIEDAVEPRTAFVLSGGGSLGAVQVGMLRALLDRGLRPDLLVGASAGALNAAFLGRHGWSAAALDRLAEGWESIRRVDVFPFEPRRHVLALSGARPSLCSNRGLRAVAERRLGDHRLEDGPIPAHVVATDLLSGREVLLSHGPAVDAVLASAAIPGVLPAVRIDGRHLVDGGIANNTPISHAVALGAERVVVLSAGVSCALAAPPTGAVATALHALTILIQQRLAQDVEHGAGRVELVVVPPLCPLEVSSSNFSRAADLMARGEDHAGRWLDGGRHREPHQERYLSLHDHHDERPERAA